MSLNSLFFLFCLFCAVAVMTVLQVLIKKYKVVVKFQLILLLVFSYFFIILTDWRFCVCIVAITLLAYLFGRWIDNKKNVIILMGGGYNSNCISRLLQVHKLLCK